MGEIKNFGEILKGVWNKSIPKHHTQNFYPTFNFNSTLMYQGRRQSHFKY